jgi:hypothetical protein
MLLEYDHPNSAQTRFQLADTRRKGTTKQLLLKRAKHRQAPESTRTVSIGSQWNSSPTEQAASWNCDSPFILPNDDIEADSQTIFKASFSISAS